MVEVIINGKNTLQPFNLEEMVYTLDFTGGVRSVNLPQMDLRGSSRKEILSWVDAGKILEGLPAEIRVDGIKLSEGSIHADKFYKDKVICDFQEKLEADFLENSTKSFTFETLYKQGIIKDSDFITIPYVISEIPRGRDVALLTLSVFVLYAEMSDQIASLIDYVAGLSDPLQFGNALMIATRAIYIGTLFLTIAKLVKDIFDLLVQKVKYHKGMSVLKHFQAGCTKLGLGFSSSLLAGKWEDAYILPEKYNLPENDKGLLGFFNKNKVDQRGFYHGTFYDFITEFKEIFNAQVDVIDDTLYLERDFSEFGEIVELKPVEVPYYETNKDDFLSNLRIRFQIDELDKNTLLDYQGNIVQYFTEAISVGNRENLKVRGAELLDIGFARGSRKGVLTIVEKAMLALLKGVDFIAGTSIKIVNAAITAINAVIRFINKLIKVLNKIPKVNIKFQFKEVKKLTYKPLATTLTDRIGLLLLENDFTSRPKLLFLNEDGSIKSNITAKEIGDDFHTDKLFDTVYENNAQTYKYVVDSTPLSNLQVQEIRKTRRIFDPIRGKEGEVTKLSWNPHTKHAKLEYEIPTVWTTNLKTTVVEPDGR